MINGSDQKTLNAEIKKVEEELKKLNKEKEIINRRLNNSTGSIKEEAKKSIEELDNEIDKLKDKLKKLREGIIIPKIIEIDPEKIDIINNGELKKLRKEFRKDGDWRVYDLILNFFIEENISHRKVIINSVSKAIKLSKIGYANPETIISWILSELKNQYDILENNERGVWGLTDYGKKYWKKEMNSINIKKEMIKILENLKFDEYYNEANFNII
jgi:hypothetical protein